MRKTGWLILRVTAWMLLGIFLIGTFRYFVGWPLFFSATRLQNRITRELPVGSSRSQVEEWLESNRIEYNAMLEARYVHKRENYKLSSEYVAMVHTKHGFPCRTDTYLALTFRGDKLIGVDISEGSVCL